MNNFKDELGLYFHTLYKLQNTEIQTEKGSCQFSLTEKASEEEKLLFTGTSF